MGKKEDFLKIFLFCLVMSEKSIIFVPKIKI